MSLSCVRCSQNAWLSCSRCFDRYCTIDCQKADWPVHRSICFRMPTLISNDDQKMTTSLVSDDTNSVKPTLISSPRVPPRVLTPEKLAKQPNDEIFEPVESTPVLIKKMDKPEASETAAAQAPRLRHNQNLFEVKLSAPKIRIDPEVVVQRPVRVPAITQEPMKEEVQKNEVLKIDEVKKEAEKFEEIKKAEEEAKKIENAKKAAEEAKKFNETKIADTVKKVEEPKKPEISPKVGNQSAEVKIPGSKETSEKSSNASKSSQPRMMYSELKRIEWSSNKNVDVKIITMLEVNVFTLCENREELDEYYKYIDDTITKHCKELPEIAYHPIQGEVVIAAYQGAWYRAHVLDPHPTGTILQFIEYGNLSTVKAEEMKPAPLDFKFSICPRDYIIDNFPSELSEKQYGIIASGSFTITNIHQDKDNLFHCEIFDF